MMLLLQAADPFGLWFPFATPASLFVGARQETFLVLSLAHSDAIGVDVDSLSSSECPLSLTLTTATRAAVGSRADVACTMMASVRRRSLRVARSYSGLQLRCH